MLLSSAGCERRASFFFFFRTHFVLFPSPEEKRRTRLAGWLALSSLAPSASFPHARARVSPQSLLRVWRCTRLPRSSCSPRTFSIPSLNETMAEAGVGPASTAADGSLIAIIGDEVRRADSHATGRESERESEERAARCLGTFWGKGRTKDAPLSPISTFFFLPQPRKTPTTPLTNNRTPSRASCSPASGTSTCAGSQTSS